MRGKNAFEHVLSCMCVFVYIVQFTIVLVLCMVKSGLDAPFRFKCLFFKECMLLAKRCEVCA